VSIGVGSFAAPSSARSPSPWVMRWDLHADIAVALSTTFVAVVYPA
jgi:hypothetical protein